MITKLQYNDLKLLLTKADLQQIKDMPEPSWQQAKLMMTKWDDYFGDKIVEPEPEKVQTGIIYIKPFIKAVESYPELLI